jgi:hypothetical protein
VDQASKGREMRQSAGANTGGDITANASALTPEDEDAHAQAQTQIEVFEGTLVEEDADPGWASAAQLALQEAFDREAIAGFRSVQADYRTSLCRLELALGCLVCGWLPTHNHGILSECSERINSVSAMTLHNDQSKSV